MGVEVTEEAAGLADNRFCWLKPCCNCSVALWELGSLAFSAGIFASVPPNCAASSVLTKSRSNACTSSVLLTSTWLMVILDRFAPLPQYNVQPNIVSMANSSPVFPGIAECGVRACGQSIPISSPTGTSIIEGSLSAMPCRWSMPFALQLQPRYGN